MRRGHPPTSGRVRRRRATCRGQRLVARRHRHRAARDLRGPGRPGRPVAVVGSRARSGDRSQPGGGVGGLRRGCAHPERRGPGHLRAGTSAAAADVSRGHGECRAHARRGSGPHLRPRTRGRHRGGQQPPIDGAVGRSRSIDRPREGAGTAIPLLPVDQGRRRLPQPADGCVALGPARCARRAGADGGVGTHVLHGDRRRGGRPARRRVLGGEPLLAGALLGGDPAATRSGSRPVPRGQSAPDPAERGARRRR